MLTKLVKSRSRLVAEYFFPVVSGRIGTRRVPSDPAASARKREGRGKAASRVRSFYPKPRVGRVRLAAVSNEPIFFYFFFNINICLYSHLPFTYFPFHRCFPCLKIFLRFFSYDIFTVLKEQCHWNCLAPASSRIARTNIRQTSSISR